MCITDKVSLISKMECEESAVTNEEAKYFLVVDEVKDEPMKVDDDDDDDLVRLILLL